MNPRRLEQIAKGCIFGACASMGGGSLAAVLLRSMKVFEWGLGVGIVCLLIGAPIGAHFSAKWWADN